MGISNILRHGLDEIALDRRGMIRTKDGAELDCTGATSVEGIAVSGKQPYKTDRRVAFKVGGLWGILRGDGTVEKALFVPFVDQDITMDSVIDEGNTVDDLQVFTSIPNFAGQKVGVAVALNARLDAPEMPTFLLSLKCRNVNDTFNKTLTSPVYDFGALSEVTAASASKEASNGGSVAVKAKLTLDDNTETDWLNFADIQGKVARKIRYQATLQAETIGVSTATIHGVATEYTRGVGVISGHGIAEIISVTKDWSIPLRSVRLRVKHSRLKDSTLKCYVAFRDVPSYVIGEDIGIGSGDMAVYSLAHTGGIHQDSLRLYFNGVRQYAGYEFNAEVGRISCVVPVGAVVSADYEYGWHLEEWQPLRNNGTLPSLETDATEFVYALPSAATPKSICAVKVAMETTKGTAEAENIGAGSGKVKSYMLNHTAKHGTMTVYGDGMQLPASAWSLSIDGKSMRVSAQKNTVLTADYEWFSETPVVRQFVAVFAE